jgi:hypothetical protein
MREDLADSPFKLMTVMLRHRWLAFCRCGLQKGCLFVRLGRSLSMAYLWSCLFLLGWNVGVIADRQTKAGDLVFMLNKYMISCFLILMTLRLLSQRAIIVNLQPLLIQPIAKVNLAKAYVLTTLLTWWNLVPVMLFGPFLVKYIVKHHDLSDSLMWFAGVLGINIMMTWLVLIIRFCSSRYLFRCLFGFAILLFLFAGPYADQNSITSWSALLFNSLLEGKAVFLGYLVIAANVIRASTVVVVKQSLFIE